MINKVNTLLFSVIFLLLFGLWTRAEDEVQLSAQGKLLKTVSITADRETDSAKILADTSRPFIKKVEITNTQSMELRYSNGWLCETSLNQYQLLDPEEIQIGDKIGLGPGEYHVKIIFSEQMDPVASSANQAKIYFKDDCENYVDIEVPPVLDPDPVWTETNLPNDTWNGKVVLSDLPKPMQRDCLWMRIAAEKFLDLGENVVATLLPPHNPYVFLDLNDHYFKFDGDDMSSMNPAIGNTIHKIKVFAVENCVFVAPFGKDKGKGDGTWENPYTDIQTAINVCPDNGTIYMAPGFYNPSCSDWGCYEILKNLTIIAQEPLKTICWDESPSGGFFKVGERTAPDDYSLSIYGIHFKSTAITLYDASLHAEGNLFQVLYTTKDYNDGITVNFYPEPEDIVIIGNVFDGGPFGYLDSFGYHEVQTWGGSLTIEDNVFQNLFNGINHSWRDYEYGESGLEISNRFFQNNLGNLPHGGDLYHFPYDGWWYVEDFGDTNPEFVDPGADDFHILPTSPLLNSGIGDYCCEANYYDLNSARNMGAYGNTSEAYFVTPPAPPRTLTRINGGYLRCY